MVDGIALLTRMAFSGRIDKASAVEQDDAS
jgi:hypothetical protein